MLNGLHGRRMTLSLKLDPNFWVVFIIIISLGALTLVSAKGSLAYGDKCDPVGSIFGVLITGTDKNDASKLCNSDKGLICTGSCTCLPTRVWHKGYIFGLFGSGCLVGANGPCGKEDTCTSNAKCGANLPLCICNEGYHAHESRCVSSSGAVKASSSSSGVPGLVGIGMIVSHLFFSYFPFNVFRN